MIYKRFPFKAIICFFSCVSESCAGDIQRRLEVEEKPKLGEQGLTILLYCVFACAEERKTQGDGYTNRMHVYVWECVSDWTPPLFHPFKHKQWIYFGNCFCFARLTRGGRVYSAAVLWLLWQPTLVLPSTPCIYNSSSTMSTLVRHLMWYFVY